MSRERPPPPDPEPVDAPRADAPRADDRAARLRELLLLFGRLGATAFGGPAAHLALMEDEVVRRRGWISRERFLDLLGATNLIPGPNSTEMAIHLGHVRAGALGLVVAGTAFIVPAALVTLAIAAAYVRFGALPETAGVLYGVKPVMIAVVVQALWRLGRTAAKTRALLLAGLAALAACALGANELVVLFATGAALALAAHLAARRPRAPGASPQPAALPLGPLAPLSQVGQLGRGAVGGAAAAGVALASAPFSLGTLFLVFAKIGSVLFGSGYVLLAFLRADFVERLGWLTEAQLLDAIAVGQVTPGPVFTTATFIGYVLGGVPGAVLATAGIFLPAFVFVALSGPLVPRLRASPLAGAFLDGVNVASLALMATVLVELGRAAVVDLPAALLAIGSAALLFSGRVGPTALLGAGAALGVAIQALGR